MYKSLLPLALLASLVSAPTLADWSLDPARSAVTYVTIKAKDVAENNSFTEMQGSIDSSGQAEVSLMLDSVETLVPIRNERMREILFQTTDYKEATLTAKVDPEAITALGVGEMTQIAAEGNLTLHGKTQPMTLSIRVAKLDDATLLVATTKPLLVDAAKFGLGDGVEKLREIAGLDSISDAVPVTFVVTFVSTPAAAQ
ncbi:YceI family protein [Thiorhodococcus mannitoliphagus]|uniref:YceI family protein n=1 Tax=Thiorhodococcus mannitoliphagus TaxID=329406 RepID=A0A6P1DVM1_9GAMM|nr:YceI family protein [Thiorhodococcus mannitoliphagus]NEX19695.1 YceI family protein [Thiorhodococcus mannitoliphagus]